MPSIGQDIVTAFISELRSDPNNPSLYVQTATGDIIKVFNPNENLPPDAAQGEFVTGTAVQVGDALYFVVKYLFGNPVDGFDHFDYVERLNRDGSVDTVVQLPFDVGNHGGQAQDPLLSAYALNGTYHIGSSELWAIGADGSITAASHLSRPGYPGVLPGVATVNDTTFAIGAQRSDSPNQLYRITARGAQEVVYSKAGSVVTDVESSAGKVWFVTSVGGPLGRTNTLWTIGETGRAVKVGIGSGLQPDFLDTSGGGLAVVIAGGGLARVDVDGTFTIVPNVLAGKIFDVCTLNGELYFTAENAGPNGSSLWHVTATGAVQNVALGGHGTADPILHESGGKLWFTGTYSVRDGFGGLTQVAAFYSIDSAGTVTVEGGIPGHRPDLFVYEGYNFTLDFPDPVIGTNDADTLNGTAKGETMSGLGDNDTLNGFAGADTIQGGAGHDLMDGGRDKDVMDGGLGKDTLIGGQGNDTLTGGFDADTFRFTFAPNNTNNKDTITDFTSALDHIELSRAAMTQLGPVGRLSADAFWSGDGVTKGHDADDRVIYNSATGTLYYDADGSSRGKAIKIAELGSFTQLEHTDILIF